MFQGVLSGYNIMNAKTDMKDDKHPFKKIKNLSEIILSFCQQVPSRLRLSPIHQKRRTFLNEEHPEDNACFQPACKAPYDKVKDEIYYQVLLNPNEFYERYKVLYLELFYLTDEREREYLDLFNQHLLVKSKEPNLGKVNRAMKDWRKELLSKKPQRTSTPYLDSELKILENRRKELIIQCYLYHVILEKVYFKYLGLVDDPILKKLFSQGLVIYGLVDIYFHYEPLVMDYLHYIGIPLANKYDNSLLLLNEGKHRSYSSPIRAWTLDFNLYRLGILRIRRLMLSLNDIFVLNDLKWWVDTFDPYVRAVMSVVNFLYFFPRFLSHIAMIIKHVFIEQWLTEEAKQLSLWMRFKVQWVRRWEILLRDSLWLANGILNFFVLLGAWGAWSLPINAFFQFVEVLLNLYLMYDFWAQYRDTLKSLSDDDLFEGVSMDKPRQDFLEDLKKRFLLEEKNRYQRLINSTLVLMSNLFVCAAFIAISVYFPLVGALLGVLMTFVQLYTRFAWESARSEIKEPFKLPSVYQKNPKPNEVSKEPPMPVPGQGVPISNMGLTLP
jgi:hypothetical protein